MWSGRAAYAPGLGPPGSRACWRGDIQRPSGWSWSWKNLNGRTESNRSPTYEAATRTPPGGTTFEIRDGLHAQADGRLAPRDIAEIELSAACALQCLDRRIPSLAADATMRSGAWVERRIGTNRQTEIELADQDGGCTDQAEELPVSTTLSVFSAVLGVCAVEMIVAKSGESRPDFLDLEVKHSCSIRREIEEIWTDSTAFE